jgi:putative membrane protein
MMDSWDHNSWVGALFGLFFFALLALLVILVLRSLNGHHMYPGQPRDPVDIARERYAKGEITKEELAEIKKQLK